MKPVPSSFLCAMVLLVAVAPAQSAASKLEQCLAAPFYPDATELSKVCPDLAADPSLSKTDRAKVNLQIGQAVHFAHLPGQAIAYFDAALNDDPNLSKVYLRRGWSNFYAGRKQAAADDFTKYLSLQPDDPDGQFAIAYANFGDSAESCAASAKVLEAILAQHPDSYLIRFNLAGRYACADGNGVRSLAELDKLVAAGRDALKDQTYFSRRGAVDFDFYARVLASRIDAEIDTRNYKAALADSDWLVTNYPKDPTLLNVRAGLREELGDMPGAMADNEKLLAVVPDHPDAIKRHLQFLNRQKRYDDVLAFTEPLVKSLDISAEASSRAYFFRAIALKVKGRKADAIAAFNAAMDLNPLISYGVQQELHRLGYVFGAEAFPDRDPPPDTRAKEFANGLEACVVDPECFVQ